MRQEDLVRISTTLILWNQHSEGAYVASPLFSNYAYCWFRDGTFTAYAMDLAGETKSADRFYQWGSRVLLRKKPQVEQLLAKKRRGEPIGQNEFLNARFHLNGHDDDAEWGHFQLDGYGTWLWGLVQHLKRTGETGLTGRYREAVDTAVDYLLAFWREPNHDCWEENGDKIHPSTLACIYGGLNSIAPYLRRSDVQEASREIRTFLLENATASGRFVKYVNGDASIGCPDVDASLLWLTVPFAVFAPDDPVMHTTIEAIEKTLLREGGVHRYPEDHYYGGGQWILLTAWLGWVYAETGRKEEARRCLEWIAAQADEHGRLPEQVSGSLLHADARGGWMKRWGTPANPLLWSHAMFVILSSVLQEVAE